MSLVLLYFIAYELSIRWQSFQIYEIIICLYYEIRLKLENILIKKYMKK